MTETVFSPTYLILLGGPGAGKGTQAQWLMTYLALARVASGDLFREHVRAQSELGQAARAYMERGELVPDELTIAMVMDRLSRTDCRFGAIFDGFPRTVGQAEALDCALAQHGWRIATVVDLQVPFDALMERLGGRWICGVCGGTFHQTMNPPREAGRCDFCGNALHQREDDKPETVANRIQVYMRQTAPLEIYYQQRGLLDIIDGAQPVAAVQAAIRHSLRQREVHQ